MGDAGEAWGRGDDVVKRHRPVAVRAYGGGESADVEELSAHVVRASSLVENFNSRLRNYFFLRRQLGENYLVLLQYFLNHRRYLRSEHPHRVDKSPTELLTGEPHRHWLELLGVHAFR